MNLLIDIGNSKIKFTQSSSGILSNFVSVSHTNQKLLNLFDKILGSLPLPEKIFVSNVAGDEVEKNLTEWVHQNWKCPIEFVKSQKENGGLTNKYFEYQKLGVDRWLAAVSAYSLYKTNICIIDLGTAITIDLIEESGNFLGGLIFPGLGLLQSFLIKNTAGCTSTSVSFSIKSLDQIVANNTQDAIQFGSLLGVIAFIEKQRVRVLEKYGTDVIFILTGGDASIVLPQLQGTYIHLPHLVLEGLKIISKN